MKRKPVMEPTLRFWVMAEVHVRLESDDDLVKEEVIDDVLARYGQCGDAYRYIRRDGKIGWKPSPAFLDRLAEAEADDEEA